MSLYQAFSELSTEFAALEAHLRNHAVSGTFGAAADFTPDDVYFLEGWLSHLWQSWGKFCRECVFQSCLGTIDGAGVHVPPVVAAASPGHVSKASIEAKKPSVTNPWSTATNYVLRKEPTWGCADTLATIIPKLGPQNAVQLSAAVSQAYTDAKTIQVIRNASAHHNVQTMAEVLNYRPAYLSFLPTHPAQAMYWVNPSTNDFLGISAMEALEQAAFAAIS